VPTLTCGSAEYFCSCTVCDGSTAISSVAADRERGLVVSMKTRAVPRFAFKLAFWDIQNAKITALLNKCCAVNRIVAVSAISVSDD
jgi:hypothetical protein